MASLITTTPSDPTIGGERLWAVPATSAGSGCVKSIHCFQDKQTFEVFSQFDGFGYLPNFNEHGYTPVLSLEEAKAFVEPFAKLLNSKHIATTALLQLKKEQLDVVEISRNFCEWKIEESKKLNEIDGSITEMFYLSSKFWKITYPVDGGECELNYGKIGSAGTIQSKDLTIKKIKSTIKGKVKKGYSKQYPSSIRPAQMITNDVCVFWLDGDSFHSLARDVCFFVSQADHSALMELFINPEINVRDLFPDVEGLRFVLTVKTEEDLLTEFGGTGRAFQEHWDCRERD